jgi:hypothetical protein
MKDNDELGTDRKLIQSLTIGLILSWLMVHDG